jgi:hypothetical protein
MRKYGASKISRVNKEGDVIEGVIEEQKGLLRSLLEPIKESALWQQR